MCVCELCASSRSLRFVWVIVCQNLKVIYIYDIVDNIQDYTTNIVRTDTAYAKYKFASIMNNIYIYYNNSTNTSKTNASIKIKARTEKKKDEII